MYISSGREWNELLLMLKIFNKCKSLKLPPPDKDDKQLFSSLKDSLRKTLHNEYMPLGTVWRSQSAKSKMGSGFSRACKIHNLLSIIQLYN